METDKETWILYQTTNDLNGRIYVGVHRLTDTFDSKRYLGSGYALKPAIKKYGRANFSRITLAEFSCVEDAYLAEAEMVTQEFIERPDTYNICLGGYGGGIQTPEMRAKLSAVKKGKKFTEEHKKKLSKAKKGRKLSPEHIAKLGKLKSKETLEKISGENHWRTLPVMINGKYYPTRKIAAEAEQVLLNTLYRRIRNTKPKWEGWRNATDEEKLAYASNALE
jgi:group I intron endonuclease